MRNGPACDILVIDDKNRDGASVASGIYIERLHRCEAQHTRFCSRTSSERRTISATPAERALTEQHKRHGGARKCRGARVSADDALR